MSDKCVHTEHCCHKHGCKYGEPDCPVVTGQKVQSFDCEWCYIDYEEVEEWLRDITYFNLILSRFGYKVVKENEC